MNIEILTTNNVWMMVCTALVFFMHLGFSLLEIGLTRQKNTINILFKNFFVITAGLLIYCFVGFNLMYPVEDRFTVDRVIPAEFNRCVIFPGTLFHQVQQVVDKSEIRLSVYIGFQKQEGKADGPRIFEVIK